MLTQSRIIPMIAVRDLDGARHFYSDVLGLKESACESDYASFGHGEGNVVMLYQKANTKPADSTRITFQVANMTTEVKELQSRGAHLESLDMPSATRDGVIASYPTGERMAWLKDPEGNWLGLYEMREGKAKGVDDEERVVDTIGAF